MTPPRTETIMTVNVLSTSFTVKSKRKNGINSISHRYNFIYVFQVYAPHYMFHILWSTTISVKIALWLRFFSFGFLAKQVYSPSSSNVMFHNKIEMLFVFEEPTNSTRSWKTWTFGSTFSVGISASHNCTHKHLLRQKAWVIHFISKYCKKLKFSWHCFLHITT